MMEGERKEQLMASNKYLNLPATALSISAAACHVTVQQQRSFSVRSSKESPISISHRVAELAAACIRVEFGSELTSLLTWA